jgi:hypothetical protein
MPRHVILLIDIDDTLINWNRTADLISRFQTISWNGGVDVWREYLRELKAVGKAHGIEIHFGIATYKMEKNVTEPSLRGDAISASVLEDETWFSYFPGARKGSGLKNELDEDLVFFTNKNCKVEYALKKAQAIVINREKAKGNIITIADKDAALLDDQGDTCRDVNAKGFESFFADNLSDLEYHAQLVRLAKIFQSIYERFKLPVPTAMKEAAAGDDTEVKQTPIEYYYSFQRVIPHNPRFQFTGKELAETESLDDEENQETAKNKVMN